jgi:glutamyl-tRNA synthetase
LTGDGLITLQRLYDLFSQLPEAEYTHDAIENMMRASVETLGLKLGQIAGILRAAITGKSVSPSLFEVIAVLGKEETRIRLKKFL